MTTYWVEFVYNMEEGFYSPTNQDWPDGGKVTFLGTQVYGPDVSPSPYSSYPWGFANLAYAAEPQGYWTLVQQSNGLNYQQITTDIVEWNYTIGIGSYFVAGTQPDPTQLVGPTSTESAETIPDNPTAAPGTYTVSWTDWAWTEITVGTSSGLFTDQADDVNFNSLTSTQTSAVAAGANLYFSMSGNDTVVLPNQNQYQLTPGVSWDPSQTFFSGPGNDSITGGDGNYLINAGSGNTSVTVNGNGSSNITAGSGGDTISITGNGNNTVTIGSGNDIVTMSGTGNNTVIDGGGDGVTITQFQGALDGTDPVNDDTVDITGLSSGNMTIGSQGVTTLDSLFDGSVIFAGTGGTLKIDPSVDPFKVFVINGFASGDFVDFANQPGLTLEAAFYSDTTGEVDIYNKATRVASLLFAGISTTTLEPVSDKNGGTEIIVDTTNKPLSDPQPPGEPAGVSIHWDIIHTNEGGDWLNPYVPINVNNPTGHSGLTIGYGIDLGNGIKQDEFSNILNNLGNDPNLVMDDPDLSYLYTATKPVIGPALQGVGALAYLQPPNGQEQIITVNGIKDPASISVSITPSQANALTNQVEIDHLSDPNTGLLTQWTKGLTQYGRNVDFTELPWQAQTALMDIDFNYGNIKSVLKDAIAAAATISPTNPNGTAAEWFTLATDISHLTSNPSRMALDALLVMQIAPGNTLTPPIDQPGIVVAANAVGYNFGVAGTTTQYAIDPTGSTTYYLIENPGSPNFSSIELPTDAADLYAVSYEIGTTWSAPQTALPDQTLTLPSSAIGLRVDLEDSNGLPIADPGSFTFYVTFATSGTFSGDVTDLSGTVSVAVVAPTGIDLTWATLYDEMANSPIESGGTATQYTCVDTGAFNNHTASIQFVITGTDFTFSGGYPNIQLTGGIITSILEEDSSNNVLASLTGLSISATTFNTAMNTYVAGGANPDPSGLNAIFLTLAYTVSANAGHDIINGGGGLNSVDYSSALFSSGIQAVIVGGNGTVIKGSTIGTDTLTSIGRIYGGAGNDVFTIDSGEVVVGGGGFNVVIEATPGATVNIGAGTALYQIQEFIANGGTNVVNGSDSSDFIYLYGGDGINTLATGTGGGYMISTGGTNHMFGGGSTNVMIGGVGSSDMHGGSGVNDYYTSADDTITGAGTYNTDILLAAGVTLSLGQSDVQQVILNGGTNSVNMTGSNDFDYLYGGAGTNTMTMGSGGGYELSTGGTNHMYGGSGAGTDVFVGGVGTSDMHGGSGSNDYYVGTNDTVAGAGVYNTLIEEATGVDLTLGSAALTGVQQFILNGGTNTLDASSATTQLIVYGGSGNDTLFGGSGNDYFWGGLGTNTFKFAAGWGQDTIMDWTSGANSQIDLTALAGSGLHAITDLTQTIVQGSQIGTLNDVITSSHAGSNSITLMGVGSALTTSSFHFA